MDKSQDRAEPKKTDTLQIRIAYQTKEAFLEACRRKGESASDVLRKSILDYLAFSERPSPEQKGLRLMTFSKPVRRGAGIFAGLAGVAALVTFAAMPSTAEGNFRTAFERLDANHDGKLALSEFTSMPFPNSLLAREARLNGGASLPSDVMVVEPGTKQASVQPRAAWTAENKDDFLRVDADGDKSVSYDEFSASLESMLRPVFEAWDANHDARLSPEEMNTPLAITADRVRSSTPQPGRSGVVIDAKLTTRAPLPHGDPVEAFGTLDRNGDGVITFEEFLPPA